MSKTVRYRGFTVTKKDNGTYRIHYNDKYCTKKTYIYESKSFNSIGTWIWNMADNHDESNTLVEKLCRAFNENYF